MEKEWVYHVHANVRMLILSAIASHHTLLYLAEIGDLALAGLTRLVGRCVPTSRW